MCKKLCCRAVLIQSVSFPDCMAPSARERKARGRGASTAATGKFVLVGSRAGIRSIPSNG